MGQLLHSNSRRETFTSGQMMNLGDEKKIVTIQIDRLLGGKICVHMVNASHSSIARYVVDDVFGEEKPITITLHADLYRRYEPGPNYWLIENKKITRASFRFTKRMSGETEVVLFDASVALNYFLNGRVHPDLETKPVLCWLVPELSYEVYGLSLSVGLGMPMWSGIFVPAEENLNFAKPKSQSWADIAVGK